MAEVEFAMSTELSANWSEGAKAHNLLLFTQISLFSEV